MMLLRFLQQVSIQKKSDIWALGITCMRCVGIISKRELMMMTTGSDMRNKLVRLSAMPGNRDIKESFANLVELCLNPEPELRIDAESLTDHSFLSKNEDIIFHLLKGPNITVRPSTFEEDMLNIYNCSIHSDIQINIDNNTIYCHRDILENRCQEIHKMIGIGNNEVTLENIGIEGLESLIKMLYTGKYYIHGNKKDAMESLLKIIRICKQYEMMDTARMLAAELLALTKRSYTIYKTVYISDLYLKSLINMGNVNVTLVAENGEINIHGILLYARCEYFIQTIKSGVTRIELPCDIEVLNAFVQYIYCDRIMDKSGSAIMKLLLLADQLRFHRLLEYCEKKLISTVEGREAKFSSWAKENNAKQLYNYCADVIDKKAKKKR
eukprot:TRINITY_DN6111_c0_g1_i1.p1 TRINITY_DN6111_c0_g1~~TRINITY_DN6111_c0_g1_i1.p1  ORF type:complete len:382 (-),score=57.16 TRINITY_DN6111_c0_g1_i1:77-1222(-)